MYHLIPRMVRVVSTPQEPMTPPEAVQDESTPLLRHSRYRLNDPAQESGRTRAVQL